MVYKNCSVVKCWVAAFVYQIAKEMPFTLVIVAFKPLQHIQPASMLSAVTTDGSLEETLAASHQDWVVDAVEISLKFSV